MTNSILSCDEINSIEELGYLRLPQAFPRKSALEMQDFMWTELKRLSGIDRFDRSTWTKPWRRLKKTERHGIYKDVGSPRLLGAIDQLLGPGSWIKPQSWGGFLVTFPQDADNPWDVTTKHWHWDGDPGQHFNGLSSLFIFTFYSQVVPGGGGTLIVQGSHRLAMDFIRSMDPNKVSQKAKIVWNQFSKSHPWLAELTGQLPDSNDRVRRFMEETTIIDNFPVRVVELTGEPGDAVICHPSIFHTRSYNRADNPRLMRSCFIGKKKT